MPRTKTRRFGPRSFRDSGPVVWNSLPEDIRIPELSLHGTFQIYVENTFISPSIHICHSSAYSAFVTLLGGA